MRWLLLLVTAVFSLAAISGPVVATANTDDSVGKVAVVSPVQKSSSASGGAVGSVQNPLVVKVHEFPDDWWAVVISLAALMVAVWQICMFRRQLKLAEEAGLAARDAANAARAALNSDNSPHIRISNPQIWCGRCEPFQREVDVVTLDMAGVFSARVYVINEGGVPHT